MSGFAPFHLVFPDPQVTQKVLLTKARVAPNPHGDTKGGNRAIDGRSLVEVANECLGSLAEVSKDGCCTGLT